MWGNTERDGERERENERGNERGRCQHSPESRGHEALLLLNGLIHGKEKAQMEQCEAGGPHSDTRAGSQHAFPRTAIVRAKRTAPWFCLDLDSVCGSSHSPEQALGAILSAMSPLSRCVSVPEKYGFEFQV